MSKYKVSKTEGFGTLFDDSNNNNNHNHNHNDNKVDRNDNDISTDLPMKADKHTWMT